MQQGKYQLYWLKFLVLFRRISWPCSFCLGWTKERRMSNIHTYEDLKDKPNASPLPDPWRKSKRQSSTIASFDDEAQLPDSEQRYLRVATLGGVSACHNRRVLLLVFWFLCSIVSVNFLIWQQEVDIPVDSFRERPGMSWFTIQNPCSLFIRTGSFLCTYCCVSLCPCFVGPLWSDDKRKSYISILLSFCFFISIVQVHEQQYSSNTF